MNANINFEKYGIQVYSGRTQGHSKTFCPRCAHTRTRNRRDRSLSVCHETGAFKCHHCGWSGYAVEGGNVLSSMFRPAVPQRREYTLPDQLPAPTLTEPVLRWFASRGISAETLRKCQVGDGETWMPHAGRRMRAIQFRYYLRETLINVKYRSGDKGFKGVSGARPIPYNLNSVLDFPEEIIITEGEIDTLSFVEAGFEHVVSVPNGANGNLDWIRPVGKIFNNAKRFILATDDDPKGRELRDFLTERLGAERCVTFRYPEGCKDANEVLVRDGAEFLRGCYEKSVNHLNPTL